MDIDIEKNIIGTDLYGNRIIGKITGMANVFRIATVKIGDDRLDMTTISFDNIDKA